MTNDYLNQFPNNGTIGKQQQPMQPVCNGIVPTVPQNCCNNPYTNNPGQSCPNLVIGNPNVPAPQVNMVNNPPPPAISSPQGGAAGQTPQATGVNIQIFQPVASTNGVYQPVANQISNPTSYYPSNLGYVTDNMKMPTDKMLSTKSSAKVSSPILPKKKKKIVPLTDEYIKTLENYLSNPNTKIRKMGAIELVKRFEELDKRRNDVALTNLLNKALQDPSPAVRNIAMAVLNAQKADGDDLTIEILKKLQSSDGFYAQDNLTSSEVLLKTSSRPIDVIDTTPDKNVKKELEEEQITEELVKGNE